MLSEFLDVSLVVVCHVGAVFRTFLIARMVMHGQQDEANTASLAKLFYEFVDKTNTTKDIHNVIQLLPPFLLECRRSIGILKKVGGIRSKGSQSTLWSSGVPGIVSWCGGVWRDCMGLQGATWCYYIWNRMEVLCDRPGNVGLCRVWQVYTAVGWDDIGM